MKAVRLELQHWSRRSDVTRASLDPQVQRFWDINNPDHPDCPMVEVLTGFQQALKNGRFREF